MDIQTKYIQLMDPIRKKVEGNILILIRKIISKLLKKISKVLYYSYINRFTKKTKTIFDYCVDFQGYGFFGTYYCINSVKSKNRITFIHDEKIDWIKPIEGIFKMYDQYFCVSNSCIKILEDNYSFTKNKTYLCRNVLNIPKIISKSREKIYDFDEKGSTILTIGRIEYQKGYDLLLEVANKLKKDKIEYKWYIIGDGSLKEKVENAIISLGLENNVVLLGMKKNPYPYIKKCKIYAQTSRHEGYGIAIAEARILGKPIITTDIECIKEQITDNENGIISQFDSTEYSIKLRELLTNTRLQKKLISNLTNNNDIEKIDFLSIVK